MNAVQFTRLVASRRVIRDASGHVVHESAGADAFPRLAHPHAAPDRPSIDLDPTPAPWRGLLVRLLAIALGAAVLLDQSVLTGATVYAQRLRCEPMGEIAFPIDYPDRTYTVQIDEVGAPTTGATLAWELTDEHGNVLSTHHELEPHRGRRIDRFEPVTSGPVTLRFWSPTPQAQQHETFHIRVKVGDRSVIGPLLAKVML